MTETEIANLAISHIGGKSLSVLATDNTPQGIACRKWFTPAWTEALASHPWNFASTRKRLTLARTALSGVALTNSSGTVQVTATAHGLATGDRVELSAVEGISGVNSTWFVTVTSANVFKLDDSVFNGSHTSGTGTWLKVPLFGWSYQYAMPSDCLRVVNINGEEANENDSVPYAVEQGFLLCNDDEVNIRYVFSQSTVTTWTQTFINAFSLLLASYIAQDLTGPSGKASELRQRFEQLISPNAKTQDSRQGKGRVVDWDYSSAVISARRGYTS